MNMRSNLGRTSQEVEDIDSETRMERQAKSGCKRQEVCPPQKGETQFGGTLCKFQRMCMRCIFVSWYWFLPLSLKII